MNLIDVVLVIPLVLGAFAGFKRGFVLEIVSFLALFLGIIGGFHFLHWGINLLHEQFQIAGKIVPFLAFLMIFTGIIVLVSIVGKALKKVVHMTPLGGVDTLVGAVIGAFKWAFMLSVFVWIIEWFGLSIPRHLTDDSSVYLYIKAIAPGTIALVGKIWPMSGDLFEELTEMMSVFD